ncbi:MAG TPA: alpha/beta hydrolase [Pyrinomonadaceae bacterium]|nr:alpha/beta hydrolase [Pyrinomonadaceae bacterium]
MTVKPYLLVRCCSIAALLLLTQTGLSQNLTFGDIEKLPSTPADHRIAYGSDPAQFGDLRLPNGKGLHPVAIIIHGGCWYSEYDLNYMASFAGALTRLGVATWNIEYRRIGNAGGGWPGTFEDVARATDFLNVLARSYPLDLRRVIVVGHSAGAQLALWLAARRRLPEDSPLHSSNPLSLQGVISLAGITDMRRYRPNCGNAVSKLLGGSPEEVALRYQQTSPVELLPLNVRQYLIHGNRDEIVPSNFSQDYEVAARNKGIKVQLAIIKDAGHFELVAPQSSAWPTIKSAVRSLLKPGKIQ